MKIMKKLVLGILLTVLASSVFAQGERILLSQMQSSDYSKWSIAIGGGYDYYRVNPFTQNSSDGFWSYYLMGEGDWTIPQISLEYTLSPLFGIGLHFGRYGFNRPSGYSEGPYANPAHKNSDKGGKYINYGAVYDLTLYGSIDLTDAIFPYRKGCWSNLSLYTDFGLGVGYYEGNLADAYIASMNKNINLWTNDSFSDGKYNGITPVFSSLINAEYSFGRRVALGLGFGYRVYMRDGMGGYNQDAKTQTDNGGTQYRGNTEAINEDGWNLTLSLRFKLGSSDKTHMRDVRLTDGYRLLEERIQQGEELIPEILNRLRNIEDITNDLKGRVGNLEDDLGKLHESIDGARGSNWGTPENPWIINGVNFVFDKTTIIEESMPILRNVLVKLIVHYNEWSELKIDGHTDRLGSDGYNQTLSLRRAEAIKKFFIDNGLGDKKFVIEGFGAQKPIAPNITPTGKDDPEGRQKNRRVEIYVIK
jgi:Outer membrane protein and related peptidoglycan-associated (lipo)proteins